MPIYQPAPALTDVLGHRATGSETLPRWATTSLTLAMTSGVARFAYFTALRTETATQASVTTGGTAAGATPTLIKYGLYSVAANGDLTQIALTASDTALLAVSGTPYAKAFASPVAVAAGSRYAFAALVVTGATAPTLAGAVCGSGTDAGVELKLAGVATGQADLAASYAAAAVTASSNMIYASVRA